MENGLMGKNKVWECHWLQTHHKDGNVLAPVFSN